MHPDLRRWNKRYQEDGESWLAHPPSELLVRFADRLPTGGVALDAAAGVAANGLFLAERGFKVFALDISMVGLQLARERFASRGFSLNAAVYDLEKIWLPEEHFDVILNFKFLERAAFSAYRRALKPGGLLFCETFVKTGYRLHKPDYYLLPDETLDVFGDYDILHLQQRRHKRNKVFEELIARKPMAVSGALNQ